MSTKKRLLIALHEHSESYAGPATDPDGLYQIIQNEYGGSADIDDWTIYELGDAVAVKTQLVEVPMLVRE